jgi:hypothetical protein
VYRDGEGGCVIVEREDGPRRPVLAHCHERWALVLFVCALLDSLGSWLEEVRVRAASGDGTPLCSGIVGSRGDDASGEAGMRTLPLSGVTFGQLGGDLRRRMRMLWRETTY